MATTLSRRTFLKAGLIGALALAATGGLYRVTRGSRTAQEFVLDGEARSALQAIARAILKDAVPAPTGAALEAEITRVQATIAGLPLHAQSEVQDLFGLLALAPARRFLAGIPDSWSEAKPEDVSAFLQSWRTHRLAMLQTAYHAMHDLVIGPWYAEEATWASIDYPGPPKLS